MGIVHREKMLTKNKRIRIIGQMRKSALGEDAY